MKRTIVIGDLHGRTEWSLLIDEDFDKFVFAADYFDTFENITAEQQIANFNKIIKFRRDNPDKVVVLEGNHDSSLYVYGQLCSGYQSGAAEAIKQALVDAKDVMQMAYLQDKYLFTHAGVSKTWLSNQGYNNEPIAEFINELYYYKPNRFNFTPTGYDITGNSISQTPIWIRPNALLQDKIEGYTQIVGHTPGNEIRFYDSVIVVDCFNTSGDYLIIEDNKTRVSNWKLKQG